MIGELKKALGLKRYNYSGGDLTALDFIGRPEEAESFARTFKHPWVKEIKAVRGYLNITVSDEFLRAVLDWQPRFETDRTVYVEYPSVNPNKPWHIGHLRNALIGESLARLAERLGYRVRRLDYINDLGLQIAETLYYLRQSGAVADEKYDHFLGKIYVEAHRFFEAHEAEVRAFLKQMETNPWQHRPIIQKCLAAQRQTAGKYGVRNDWTVYESDLLEMARAIMDSLKARGVLRPGEGKKAGTWVFEDGTVAIRSDGTLTYIAKDIAYQLWKYGETNPLFFVKTALGEETAPKGSPRRGSADEVINIIGAEQTQEQGIVRGVVESLGHGDYYHVAYDHVVLPTGRFSGRKGTWMGFTADELYGEAAKRGEPAITVSAVKFWILKTAPEKKVVFDWDRALSLKGDSGPYIQYAYVRAKRILQNLKGVERKDYAFSSAERSLILSMAKYEEALAEAWRRKRPSTLAQYALDLAYAFSVFYEKHKVSGTDEEWWRARIVRRFKTIMEELLNLLVMDCPDSM